MNEKRRPEHRDNGRRPERRAARFAERREPVEEIEGQLEGRNALQVALKCGRTIV